MIYTQNNEVSQELVQDAFLSLWNSRKNLRDDSSLITYLMVILRNKCLNYLEQTNIKKSYIEELDDDFIYQKANQYVLQDDASKILEADDLHNAIERALNKLPEKTREIFLMSRYDGLKNQEIADIKNLSVKTVEFHITKALHLVKENLPQEYWVWVLLLRFIL